MIPLLMLGNQNHRFRKQNGGYQGLRKEGMAGVGLMSSEFVFCKMKRVLNMDGGAGCTTRWMYLIPLNYMFKNGQDGKILHYVYSTQ